MRQAGEILHADPGIAGRSLPAAAVLGDAAAVREHLAADPGAALALDDERGWPPLLYACYSRWHHSRPRPRARAGRGGAPAACGRGRREHQRRRTGPLPLGPQGIGRGQQPVRHRGAPRCRRASRPGPAHRRGRRPPRPAVPAPAALPRRPGDQHLGAGGGGVQRQSRCGGAAARRPRNRWRPRGGRGQRGAARRRRHRVFRHGRSPPGRRSGPAGDGFGRDLRAAPGGTGGQAGDRGPAAGARRRRGRHRGRPVSRRVPERRPPCGRAVARRPP